MLPRMIVKRARVAFPVMALAVALTAVLAPADPVQAQGQGGEMPPTSVGVITLKEQSVPYVVTLPGRAVAYEETEIRPRVEGVIEDIPYTPGVTVNVGDLLFTLDSDTYEVNLSAAEAAMDSAEAQQMVAQATVDRYSRLSGVSTVTQADLDSAEADLAQARADVASAQASLQAAQLDLARTEIRSPIKGIVDIPAFSVGTLVTANQTDALTTVTRLNPIYVDVQESSAQMLRHREMIDNGTIVPLDDFSIALTLETGETYNGKGTLVSPRNQVSTTTGTIDFRIVFDNDQRLILPGQFLRVKLTVGTTNAILVPQRATSRSTDGTLTAFVADDGTARQATLTYTGTYENSWVVTAGVEPGDQLIVDGLQDLKAGTAVSTVPVRIDAEGIVKDVDPAEDTDPDSGDQPQAMFDEDTPPADGTDGDASTGSGD